MRFMVVRRWLSSSNGVKDLVMHDEDDLHTLSGCDDYQTANKCSRAKFGINSLNVGLQAKACLRSGGPTTCGSQAEQHCAK
jgi:hypothetical protein